MLLDPRSTRRGSGLLALALLLGFAHDASAQARYPIKIKSVRIGLPPGPFSRERDEFRQPYYIYKGAAWAPVWVELECGKITQPAIEITVETPDGDDLMSSASIVVPAPPPGVAQGHSLGRIPYLKPGGTYTDVTVSIHVPGSSEKLAESFTQRSIPGLAPAKYLLLSVGSSLPGFRLPKATAANPQDVLDAEQLRNGQVELAQIISTNNLPDQWFGYSGVDLLILTTGQDRSFYEALANDPKRRAALREWIRRGGHIIVSVGANADLFSALPELREMLPARIAPEGKRFMDGIAVSLPSQSLKILRPPPGGKLALQSVEAIPDRPYLSLLTNDATTDRVPLVVQSSFGLGRVTLVAFDLDAGSFVDFDIRDVFWEWLINASSTRLPPIVKSEDRTDDEDDRYVTAMQNNLEFFEGVPVISFGWVALFILFYILLIGPVEYIILKRLFKRLEWTWVTFPIIVATVSAAAYFTAYDLKGRDLKVNKIDLVDIDLQGNRVYGNTWFTIFSPRIQNYTIGIEPAGPRGDDPSGATWSPEGLAQTRPDTLVSWHGKARSSRQSLFRRSYSYDVPPEPDASGRWLYADGLDQVPIQVWSTKSFTASWAARFEAAKPPFASTLRMSDADPNQITGSVTCNLPVVSLTEARLFYRDHVTTLPTLARGAERFVSTSNQAAAANSWLQTVSVSTNPSQGRYPRGYQQEASDDPTFRLWPVLFHGLLHGPKY